MENTQSNILLDFISNYFLFFPEDDTFEFIPTKSKSSSTVQPNPVSAIVGADKPTSTTDVKSSAGTSTEQHPIRYGTAALIPHSGISDYQSLLTRQPYRPVAKNNLLDILQNPSKSQTPVFSTNKLQDLVNENDHDRRSLVELAKQTQKDFLSALQLD